MVWLYSILNREIVHLREQFWKRKAAAAKKREKEKNGENKYRKGEKSQISSVIFFLCL